MDKEQWEVLNRLVLEATKTLEHGRHSTPHEWSEIGDELRKASEIAYDEADRLIVVGDE